jgi:hypothetical protein
MVLIFSAMGNCRKSRGLEICISRPFSVLVAEDERFSNQFVEDLERLSRIDKF